MKNIKIQSPKTYVQALEEYISATNSHDFQKVEPYIQNNAVFLFLDKSYEGIEGIKAYFETTWSLIKEEDYQIKNVKWLHVTGSSALCIYQYHWRGIYGGNVVNGFGKATNVMMRENDRWVLIHEHLTPST